MLGCCELRTIRFVSWPCFAIACGSSLYFSVVLSIVFYVIYAQFTTVQRALYAYTANFCFHSTLKAITIATLFKKAKVQSSGKTLYKGNQENSWLSLYSLTKRQRSHATTSKFCKTMFLCIHQLVRLLKS